MSAEKKKSKMERKLYWSDLLSPLLAWGQLVLLTAAAIAVLLLLWVIIRSAGELGALFLPALLGYFAALCCVAGWLHHRKELREILAVVGPEEFYRAYPGERARMERRRKWQENLDEWLDKLNKRKGKTK